jgi:hypothetical protein
MGCAGKLCETRKKTLVGRKRTAIAHLNKKGVQKSWMESPNGGICCGKCQVIGVYCPLQVLLLFGNETRWCMYNTVVVGILMLRRRPLKTNVTNFFFACMCQKQLDLQSAALIPAKSRSVKGWSRVVRLDRCFDWIWANWLLVMWRPVTTDVSLVSIKIAFLVGT